jgi:hypothetical protein
MEFTVNEYNELVDYMTRAVDQYATLPEDIEKKIDEKA